MPSTASYQIPNLPSLCGDAFELRTNRHCRAATQASQTWVQQQGFLDADEAEGLKGARLGLLAALCFTTCDVAQLQLATDFITLMFHWWDRGVDGENGRAAFKNIWTRLCRTTTTGWQARFQHYLEEFENAGMDVEKSQEACQSLESYLSWSRRSSGFIMGLALIEYTEGLQMHEDVFNAPELVTLRHATLDLIIWMHDIASYNVQQASNHNYNAVAVLMSEQHVTLQTAMNRAGERVKALVGDFLAQEKAVVATSWGPYVDRDVRMYVVGLRDWIIGTAHWVYQCDRYFQGKGENVKAFGWVFLLPKNNVAGGKKLEGEAST